MSERKRRRHINEPPEKPKDPAKGIIQPDAPKPSTGRILTPEDVQHTFAPTRSLDARPDMNELFLGKSRRLWLRDAARAIIASTDMVTRYLIIKGGYVAFEQRTRPAFKNSNNFDFTTYEIRYIWDYLHRWANRKDENGVREVQLWPGIARLLEKTKRVNSTDRFNEEADGDGSDMEVEAIRDGGRRRVH